MLFSNQIVIYGTGGAAKNFIEKNKEYKDRIFAAVEKMLKWGDI